MRESIESLARRIREQPHLDEAEKATLLELVAEIESEVDAEAAGEEQHPVKEAMQVAAGTGDTEGFEERLLKLEASYPKTAAALGRIGHVLARMGI